MTCEVGFVAIIEAAWWGKSTQLCVYIYVFSCAYCHQYGQIVTLFLEVNNERLKLKDQLVD